MTRAWVPLHLALIFMFCAIHPASAQRAWQGSYPEGPVWIGSALYWAEMTAHRVMALRAGDDAAPRPFFQQRGCGPTAIARYKSTDFLVLCHLDGSLAHLDGRGRPVRMIRRADDGRPLRNPNDASADGKGGVWFTDPGRFSAGAPAEGALYHLDAEGRLTRHAEGLFYGNGVHVDRAGRRLLVSEHLARRVLVYPLTGQGIGPPTVLIDLDNLDLARPTYPEAGPDGLEIGPDGTLWFAEYGAGRLLGWREGVGLVAVITVDLPYLTNIAFGPGGLAAMTGARDNRRPPFAGETRVFGAERLTDLVAGQEERK